MQALIVKNVVGASYVRCFQCVDPLTVRVVCTVAAWIRNRLKQPRVDQRNVLVEGFAIERGSEPVDTPHIHSHAMCARSCVSLPAPWLCVATPCCCGGRHLRARQAWSSIWRD